MAAANARLAGLIVVATGSLWGVYWVPVRRLAELGLPGAWGSLGLTALAALLLAPAAWRSRARLAATPALTLAAIALGGAAFVLYSVGLVHGRVAIVILLFYLTPVWSTLIARLWLGWPTPALRYAAILVGLVGLALVLGGQGGVPWPQGLGDWLGLASGVLWSVSSTGIRTRNPLGPAATAFVFALGAAVGAALLVPLVGTRPGLPQDGAGALAAGAWLAAGAALWWGLSMAGLLWATGQLEPARVGILLMSEVLVGVISAALFAGEPLGPVEAVGGALVVAAAVLEVWPLRAGPR